MKKEIATLWTDALRSGKYQQGTGRLKSSAGYCCLGVLCELSEQGEFISKSIIYGDTTIGKYVYVLPNGIRSETYLPNDIMNWAGMSNENGTIHSDSINGITPLTYRNDHGSSFAEIADLIDKHWEKL